MAYLASISPYKQRKNISQLRSGVEAGLQQLRDFDFSVENPYEDMTVNLQAAQMQQQGLAQQQADILAGLRGAGGGAGAAALATGLARQASKARAAISADLGQQEQQLAQKTAEAQFKIDQEVRRKEYGRMESILGIEMQQLAAAEQAKRERDAQKAAEKSALGGVLGSIIGAGIGFLVPGGGAAVAGVLSGIGGAGGAALS